MGIVRAQIGFTAPNFTVVDTHGDTIRLYDILDEGKYVVLDFFYTTCGPCIYYTPQVNLAYEKYGCNTQDVVFIAIDYQDTNAEVLAYDAQYGIQYPSVSGTQGGGNGVVSQYFITGFPTFLLIDSTYKIIDEISPPTLLVFDFRFGMHGIQPAPCLSNTTGLPGVRPLAVRPNPVQEGSVTVELPADLDGNFEVVLLDLTGRWLFREKFRQQRPATFQLDMEPYPAGLYVLKVQSEQGTQLSARLVKK